MKKFISLLVAFAITFNFICVQVAAEGEITSGTVGEKTTWRIEDETLIFRVGGASGIDKIPDYTSDSLVLRPWDAFKDTVTAIKVESGRLSVGNHAFDGFEKLTDISNLMEKVDGFQGVECTIGDYAFANTGISGELFVKAYKVGKGAFENCKALESVEIDRYAVSLGDEAFKGCSNIHTVRFNSKSILTSLGNYTFEECANLSKIENFPVDQIKEIGPGTFKNCSSLNSILFLAPDTTAIGDYAFSGTGIDTAILPDKLDTLGIGVFKDCLNLSAVKIPEKITEISDSLFSGNVSLENISLHDGVTVIGDSAFNGCTALKNENNSFILSNNVTKVKDFAFNGCVNLKAVFVPKAATVSGGDVVSDYTYILRYLQSTDGEGDRVDITDISSGNPDVEKVDIPTHINNIQVKSVYEKNDVGTNIRELVSQNHNHFVVGNVCTICGLTGGTSNNTSWIIAKEYQEDGSSKENTLAISPIEGTDGSMAAYDENNLPDWCKNYTGQIEKLQIREGVTRIGAYSFSGLTLEDIVIPSSVTHIGNHAFEKVNFTDTIVWIPENVTAIGGNIFDGSNISMIFYPAGLSAGNAFPDKDVVIGTYVVNGNSVKVNIIQGEELVGTDDKYELPSYWNDKKVISENCKHQFDSEYGNCTKCGIVKGGNMGKTGENASDPANDNVTWYYSTDDNTIYINTKKNDGTPITDAAIKNYDNGENKNPFNRLIAETGAKPADLIFDGGITSIGSYAFYNLDSVTAVKIPSSVTIIGDSAFEGCLSVAEITLPDGLETISKKAFFNISFKDPNAPNYISFVDIPESVTLIGEEAFANCNNLYYVAYPENLSVDIAGIPPEVFKLKYKTLTSDKVEVTEIIRGKPNALISMPETICGKNVVRVFHDDNDENRKFHDLVNKNNCKHTWLDEATNKCPVCGQVLGSAGELPDDEVNWRFDNFVEGYGNNVLTIFTSGNGYMHDYSKGENAPWHKVMENIRTVVIQEGVLNIGDYAFKGAKDLIEVIYPSTLKKIGAHAFENCVTYNDVTIPETVTELGTDVFFDVTDYDGMHNNPFITLRKELYNNHKSTFFTEDNKTESVLLLYEDTTNGRQITGAVLTGGFDRDRLQPYELSYPVSDGHNHCFNGNNICILCGTVGGNCGPDDDPTQTTWALTTGNLSVTGDGVVAYHPWIDNYKESVKNVLIGKGVVSICKEAFKDCINLVSVQFEAGSVLSDISQGAFSGCTALKSIELPEGIETIDAEAFKGSGLIGQVIIPSSITKIEKDSFADCSALTNLLIPDSFADKYRPNTPEIDLSSQKSAVLVYSNDGSAILGICVPTGSTDVEVNIPSEIFPGVPVTEINGIYKGNVENISKVILPDTITHIADRAFEGFGSAGLEINIPQSVNYIGESAFEESAIRSVTLPVGVDVIAKNAFFSCKSLESVFVSSSLREIGEGAFGACISLKAVNASNNPDVVDFRGTALTSLADGAFAGCSAITKAVLPLSLENVISSNVFMDCEQLTILEIPELNPSGADISYEIIDAYDKPDNKTTVIVYREIDNVPQITSAVLGDENNWTNGYITNENDVIDNWLIVWKDHKHCFNNARECVLCKQQGGKCGETATWVYDKNRYTIIINSKEGGDGVMWDMVESSDTSSDDHIHYQEMWATLKGEIQEVIINEGMTTIGRNAFKDCPNLTTVHIPSTLKTIGASAFESSPNLRVVYIADNSGLMSIEANAFSGCKKLKNIGAAETAKLPQNLKYIRDGAFENCSSLPEIVIPDSVTTIGSRAFAGCTGLANAKLSLSLDSLGKEAFEGCSNLKEIVVSPRISGDGSVFANCDNLIFAVIPHSFNESNFTEPGFVTFVKYALTDNTNLTSNRIITEVKPVPGTTVAIPDYIMGYPVTEIGSRAFKANPTFNQGNEPKINLPSTLVTIHDFAFEGCTWLKELILPEGLITIGTQAFEGCVGLTEIVIPDTVTQLGMEAFNMCTKLETVKLSANLREIKNGTFNGCAKLQYVIVPEGVTAIGEKAFKDCSELEFVLLPFSSRNGSLELNAFDGCTGLAAIYAPTAVDIDYANGADGEYSEAVISTADAVAYKLRLAVYDQYKQVFKVIDGTSDNGRSTYEKVLSYPVGFAVRENPEHFHCFNIHNQCILCGDRGGKCGPDAWWTLDEKGSLTIYTKDNKDSVIDHDSPEYFGTWTEFKDRIYTINISEGITLIDSGAFEHCLRLQSVTLPDSLETVEDYAFSDCISLISIDLPDGIISLGEGVFKDDINLKNVVLPKSISELKKDTFNGCRTLETIKLPADLRYVREGAFSGCISLTSIELPVDTRTVSEDAFSDCTNLTYIVAPDGCRYNFDEDEFPNATYFKYAPEGIGVRITYARPGANVHHLVIPFEIAGLPVVAIGDGAFTRAGVRNAVLSEDPLTQQGLVSVTIPEDSLLTEIGNNAFKDRTDLQELIVKNNKIVSIGKSAFEGCISLEKAMLPASVQKIGDRAFFGCVKLTNIPIYEGLLSIGTEAFANCGFNRAFVIVPSTVSQMGTNVFGNISDNALIAISQKLAKRYENSHTGNMGDYDFRNDNCGYVVYRVDQNGNKWVTEGKLGNGQNAITGFENYMKIASDHVHCLYKGFCVLCNFAGGGCGVTEDENGNSNATWYIDRETRTLHINGTGKMKEYVGDEVAPWLEWNDFIARIEVHDGIKSISANAFVGCENVTSAKLPSTLGKIGSNAFAGNTALTSVTIPEGVETIPENAFKDCVQLKEVNLPKSVAYIKAGAFAGCTNLKYIVLPDAKHNITIDKTAFGADLDYIAMPDGTVITAETPPYNRFTYSLDDESSARIVKAQLGSNKELKFPASIGGIPVKAIGGSGYGNVISGNEVKDIRIVSIPDGVIEIYEKAFAGCENLFSLSLPDSLQTIGKEAFSGCGGIKELVFKNGLKSIGEYAFSNCGALEIVKLPLGIESIGNYAFSECDNLDIIVTPKNVIDNRGYTPTASLVYYERRDDGRDYIAAARLGQGKTNINVDKVRALGVELDIDRHEHCYNEGVCVLCNDDGGLCGVGVVWKLNGDTLELKLREGLTAREADTGEMYDYSPSNPAPWIEYKDIIKKLVIRDGVKSVGSYAFSGLTSLSDISGAFPDNLVKIGAYAFENCTSIIGDRENGNALILKDNVSDVASTAFTGCTALKKIILSDSTASALNVPEDTAVLKYRFIDSSNVKITKIEISDDKKTDVPNVILDHRVVEVAKEYRKYVNTDTHVHYHEGGNNRCTICDIISGECGDKVTWYIDETNKLLVIEGEGAMYDYNVDSGKNAPWTQYADLIDAILIKEGVTYIGDNAFVDMGSFDEITLPPGIKSVGDNVFAGSKIRRMYIPSGLKSDLFGKDIEKVTYKISEDGKWVDVTRIDLPEGKTKISLPKTIYNLPVRSVEKEFRKYVDQNDGHVHDYGEEHGESECRICGKISYNHIWKDEWNKDDDYKHWHDCERGDYDPIKDGNLDGSGYGDHDWVDAGKNPDGKTIYRCSVCGKEKLGGSTGPGPGPDNPNPPVTSDQGGFTPPPSTGGNNGGDTTKPPSPGDNGGNGSGDGSTTRPPNPWETEATEKPPIINPPTDNIPDEEDFNGTYSFDIEKGDNSLNATVADSTSSLIKAVLTEEERDKLINGTSDIRIILSVTEGDGTVSLRDRAIISAALGEYKLGTYLDISLYKVVDGVRERITHTSAPITITLDIPNSLKNSGRRFRVIRAHDGSASVLRDLDNSANTVTISTDRFSPYAIAYTDSINVSDDYDPPMPTGDPGISAFIFVTMASGLTAVGMIYFNHASDVEVEEEKRKKIAKLIAFGKKGKLQKYIAIPLIFLVTLYYQGIEGIQKNSKKKAEE